MDGLHADSASARKGAPGCLMLVKESKGGEGGGAHGQRTFERSGHMPVLNTCRDTQELTYLHVWRPASLPTFLPVYLPNSCLCQLVVGAYSNRVQQPSPFFESQEKTRPRL